MLIVSLSQQEHPCDQTWPRGHEAELYTKHIVSQRRLNYHDISSLSMVWEEILFVLFLVGGLRFGEKILIFDPFSLVSVIFSLRWDKILV